VIRAGMMRAGCGTLGRLLAADRGHRGPRVPCGQGHEAGFVSYRDKVIDAVLGPLTLTRAWYHCVTCKHGLAPRDAELGVEEASMSPGLRAMNDQAAAIGPFAEAARLLENLAGVRLTVKRVERAAEASGTTTLRCQLPGGQQARRPDLARTAQPDTGRLTRRTAERSWLLTNRRKPGCASGPQPRTVPRRLAR
jgi:hypothetical protein